MDSDQKENQCINQYVNEDMIFFRYCIERLNLFTDIARALMVYRMSLKTSFPMVVELSCALVSARRSHGRQHPPLCNQHSFWYPIDETRHRGHRPQRARSIAQFLYLICPDDEGDLKENLGAEKRVYSSIHVLLWAPKLNPVSSACARAPVLSRGGCDVPSQAPFDQD